MKQRMTALILSLALSLGMLVTGASAAGFSRSKTYTPGQFTDVAATAWYATSVKDCYELGLMNGSSATTFNPTGMFTVAEAATIAARMHNIYAGGNGVIPSAAGAWYQGAVDYCVKNNIFAAGAFDSYTRPATRAEMATIMAAALPDSAWTAKNQVTQLPDVTAVTPGAEAIFKLYNAGVFTGSDEYGKFQPYANITRAEVAAIVARCADESQRKTLNLTPMSQEGMVIPKNVSNWSKMSNGRMKFQDPTTEKYGYMDGSGKIVIPAIYDYAEDFYGGYAAVDTQKGEDSLRGNLINTNGAPVLTLEDGFITWNEQGWGKAANMNNLGALIVGGKIVTAFEYKSDMRKLGNNAFLLKKNVGGQEKSFLVNAAGKEITSSAVKSALCNEFYVAAVREAGVDIFDQASSKPLYHIPGAGAVELVAGSRLIKVQEGNKYALFAATGRITEAVYDNIELVEYSQLAHVKYGNTTGVAGLNGEIFAPGTCSYAKIINNDYISIIQDGKGYIADNTGILFQLDKPANIGFIDDTCCVGDDPDAYPRTLVAFDRSGKALFSDLKDIPGAQIASYAANQCIVLKYSYHAVETWVYYFEVKGQRYGPYFDATNHVEDEGYGYSYAAKTSDGTWDYFNTRGDHGTGYETADDALGASMHKTYSIKYNNAGKPCVAYGNEWGGYTPVIEFYKNNMYYDEIEDLGEGYYACLFNTTWYLRHV